MDNLVLVLRVIQIVLSLLCCTSGVLLIVGPHIFLRLSELFNKPVFSIEGLRAFLDRQISTKKLEEMIDRDVSLEQFREKLDRSVVIDKQIFELRYYVGTVALVTGVVLLCSYLAR